jgi:hypothetical protein
MYNMSDDKIFNRIDKIPITKDGNIKLLDKVISDMKIKLQNTTNDDEKTKLTSKLVVLEAEREKADLDGGRRKRRTKRRRHSRRRRTTKAK